MKKLTENEEIARVLERAADKIQKYGWLRKEFGNCGRGFCTVGAIRASTDNRALSRAVEENLFLQLPIGPFSLFGWNDRKARNKREVVTTLRRAARQIRKEVSP